MAPVNGSLLYSIYVPENATFLELETQGGSGDADLYVRHGLVPTEVQYDCKSSGPTNAGACHFAAPAPGIHYVRLKAYQTFQDVTLSSSYRVEYGNYANYAIADNATVHSPIEIVGRSGNAPADARVVVKIRHGYRNDLTVDLLAPDGTVHPLFDRSGGSADDIIETVVRNLSAEAINGTWTLRVRDWANGDTGFIDSWRLRL